MLKGKFATLLEIMLKTVVHQGMIQQKMVALKVLTVKIEDSCRRA